ncbi:MAG: hypothetical protein H0V17_08380 [Deltaproteobacteria bacterium]|nr:hypothetical protein [Deltaproteobacteria bacterium]
MTRPSCVVLALLAACGPELTIHERTAPIRVTVNKQASRPELRIAARFVATNSVELVAKHATEVRISRVVHYGSTTFEMGSWNPIIEILEIPAGLFILLFPGFWSGPYKTTNTSTRKAEVHNTWLVALLNPFQTTIKYRIRTKPTSDASRFLDPPVIRELEMRLPVPGLVIAFRALDEGERAVAHGVVTTDQFGRATIADLPGAVALEVTVRDVSTVIAIDPEVPK